MATITGLNETDNGSVSRGVINTNFTNLNTDKLESDGMYVSVKTYGAVGDGVTDDTAAIQDALDNEGQVYFPAGTYLVSLASNSACILPNSNNSILGAGIGVTKIKLEDSENAHVISLMTVSNIRISNLEIDGNRANQTSSMHCIRGMDITNVWLDNLYLHDPFGYGIGFQEGTMKQLYISNIRIENTGSDGIDFKNPDDANQDIFLNNISVYSPGRNGSLSTQAGIDIRGVACLNNIQVTGLDSDQDGIRFRETGATTGEGATYSSLSNFYCQGTGATSQGVYCPADRVAISNGTVVDVNIGVFVYGLYNKISNVHADNCNLNGFLTDANAAYCIFDSCQARSCNDVGFRIKSDSGIMNACISRSNVAEGLETTGDSDGWIITSNQFLSNGAANTNSGANITQANNVGY